MKTSVLLMMAAAVLVVPACAEDAVTTPPAAQGDAASDESYLDKVVCKKLPPPTGTRLGARKVCQTERQWRSLTKSSQDDINQRQQRLGGYGGPGG